MGQPTFIGIPRESIHWFPTIDPDFCNACGECLDLCSNGVFAMNDEKGVMEVVAPMNCVVLCDKCAPSCATEAISFPDKIEARHEITRLIAAQKAAAGAAR